MEAESIDLVGRQVCEECDAFLGKEHRIGCSKSGAVIPSHATEKFTTVERAEAEEPLIGINRETCELILRSLIPAELGADDAEKLRGLRGGLEQFVAAAREAEAGAEDTDA